MQSDKIREKGGIKVKPEKELAIILKMNKLKKHYSSYKSKDLLSLKAAYEAREEDNKQIAIVIALVGASLALVNFALSILKEGTELFTLIVLIILILFVVSGAVLIGFKLSDRVVETTSRRKAIELVLAERNKRNKAK